MNSRQGYPHRIGQEGTAAHFRNVETVVVDDAGHWTHHDQLSLCTHVIGNFLGVPLAAAANE